MSEHTKEPWSITHGAQGSWHLSNANEEYAICSRNQWPGRARMSVDNGERVLAAVNFTAGFSTEALNGSSLAEVVEALEDMIAWARGGPGVEKARTVLSRLTTKP